MRFLLILPLVLLLGVSLVLGQDAAPAGREVDGRKSGYLYMSAETQALQDDDFLNPGMFAVETGRALWAEIDGSAGKSCASCHEAAETTMIGVAARYPLYDEPSHSLMNLELRINQMRTEHMGAAAYPYESPQLLALTAYVAYQSRGLPVAVAVDGPAAPFFEEGRDFYFTRRGQLNLSCAQCHDDRAGQRLRGDVISEGQATGYPIYRLLWRAVASRHRMFEWCNTSIRAEPYPLGSPQYLSLELYVAWRGRGLAVETPAVRR